MYTDTIYSFIWEMISLDFITIQNAMSKYRQRPPIGKYVHNSYVRNLWQQKLPKSVNIVYLQ